MEVLNLHCDMQSLICMQDLVPSESEITQSCPTFCDPVDCSNQAPPSMGFSRQEYWSGVPSPSPSEMLVSTKKEQSTDTATWINLKVSILNGNSQTQKTTYCMVPFT